MNKLVVFDIDGVLAAYEPKLVQVLVDRFGEKAAKGRNLFSLEKRYSEHPEILNVAKGLTSDPNFYYDLESEAGALSFISQLADSGFPIMFVTSRPAYMESVTRRWLLKNFGAYFEESLGLFCGIESKAKFVADLKDGVEFVVEDNPENIREIVDAGFMALCWDQTWNQGVFPRLYIRSDGELMLWADESKESAPFWLVEQEQ